jgi:hypothetical protein
VQGEDSFPEGGGLDFLGNCVEQISLPGWVVEWVAKGEGDVGIMVLLIGLDYNV